MDFHIQGSRPPSARSHVKVNPITGEKMTDCVSARSQHPSRPPSRPMSRPGSRPQDVPVLNLGGLGDQEEYISSIPLELDPYHYKLDTPGSASTVSWGTPHSTKGKVGQSSRNTAKHSSRPPGAPSLYGGQHSTRSTRTQRAPAKSKKPSAWDAPPVPDNVPLPSERHRQQYKQMEEEMRLSYRQKGIQVQEDRPAQKSVAQKMPELKLDLTEEATPSVTSEKDEELEQLQKAWTTQPYSKAQVIKRRDLEELETEKKKNKLIETVMIDQLSRAVISHPEQNEILSQRASPMPTAMRKGSVRLMHQSRVQPAGSATENLLARRVQFGARVVTRVGRDAIRELTGFFFAMDNSLTIYEYRQFGKSTKAMPFINRDTYCHLLGRKKEQPYTLVDITPGSTLYFSTHGQPLPDSMLSNEMVLIRVTDVDNEAKGQILLENISRSDQEEVWRRLHMPETKEELQDQCLLKDVQASVQKQLRKRGIKVITGLGHMFRKLDDSGDGKLNKYELEKALIDFHINIPDDKFDDLWEVLDVDCSSFLDYGEFMRGFIGEMSEERKALVRKAFQKLDSNKKGAISLGDMRKFYNAHKHPSVKSGECSEAEALERFLASFDKCKVQGEVSYTEFEEYYEGLSLCVESDEDFTNTLRNAWSV